MFPLRFQAPGRHMRAPALLSLALLAGCVSNPDYRHSKRVHESKAIASTNLGVLRNYYFEHPEDVGAGIALCEQLMSQGKKADAQAMVSGMLGTNRCAQVLLCAARIAEDPKVRHTLLLEAIQKDPEVPDGYLELGRSHRQLGDAAAADQCFAEHLKRSVMDTRSSVEGIRMAFDQRDYVGAAVWIEACLTTDMDAKGNAAPFYWDMLAAIYEDSEEWPDAAAWFRARSETALAQLPDPSTAMRFTDRVGAPVADLMKPIYSRTNLGLLPVGYDPCSPWNRERPARIFGVWSGTLAAEAGVLADDIVLKVNEIAVTKTADFAEVYNVISSGDAVTICVQRGDTIVSFVGTARSMEEAWVKASTAMKEGEEHFNKGDFAAAATHFEQARIAHCGLNRESFEMCVLAWMLGGKGSEAKGAIERWLTGKTSPRLERLLAMANAWSGFGGSAAAVDQARRARDLNPTSGMCEALLGLATERAKREKVNDDARYESPHLARATALGCGGRPLQWLAQVLDAREQEAFRQGEATRARNRQLGLMILAAYVKSTATTAGGGSTFGSNPYVDYGYHARDMYGVSAPMRF